MDRQSFVDRFTELLVKMGMDCLAWALMSNHVHLLLRPSQTNLARFMRRLLTAHAVTFRRQGDAHEIMRFSAFAHGLLNPVHLLLM
nr:transposase [Geomonas nitrogeniifigens]